MLRIPPEKDVKYYWYSKFPTHHFKQLFQHSRMQWSKFLHNLYIRQLNWGITMIHSITSLRLCIAVKNLSRFNTIDPKPYPCHGRRHSLKTKILGSWTISCNFCAYGVRCFWLHRMICQRNYQTTSKSCTIVKFFSRSLRQRMSDLLCVAKAKKNTHWQAWIIKIQAWEKAKLSLPESRIAFRAKNFLECQNETAKERVVSLVVALNSQGNIYPYFPLTVHQSERIPDGWLIVQAWEKAKLYAYILIFRSLSTKVSGF
jgi:hypothetical protein